MLTLTILPREAGKVLRATGITVDFLHYVDSSTTANGGDALLPAGWLVIWATLFRSTAAIPAGSPGGRATRIRCNLSNTEERTWGASNPEYQSE